MKFEKKDYGTRQYNVLLKSLVSGAGLLEFEPQL